MKKCYLLLLVAATFGACQKNNDNSTARANLLTARNWRMSADTYTTVDNGTATTSDEYAKLPACKRDDFLKFNADKSLTTDEGATRCGASLPQTLTGEWDFNSDQTTLTSHSVAYSSFILLADIVELSATTLRLRTVTSVYPAATRTEDITYTAF